MLKLAPKPAVSAQNLAAVTSASSLEGVKTLFRHSFGTIAHMRGLLPEDNLESKPLTSTSSKSHGHTGSQDISSRKIGVIKRGISTEGNRLLDYLELGVFDAIEKQYLKNLVFAIGVNENDPNNVIESYTFSVSYHEIGPDNTRIPSITIESGLSQLHLSRNDLGPSTTQSERPLTLGEMKRRIKVIDRMLVQGIQSLEALPVKCFVTFKIYYHDHTPQEYEPPGFAAGDSEKDRFFFATHNIREAPERITLDPVDLGAHTVQINTASVCQYLPSAEDSTAVFTGLGDAVQTFHATKTKRETNLPAQLEDIELRQVVWGADPDDDRPGENEHVQKPLGVKEGDEIVPLRWKGKEVVRHKAGQHHVPELDHAGAPNAAEEPTQVLETQATVVIPDTAHPIQERRESDTMEVDQTPASGEANQSINGRQDAIMKETPANEISVSSPDARIHPETDFVGACWKPVDCDCKIKDESQETFHCRGSCARRLHVWCMGLNTAQDVGKWEDATCLNCVFENDNISNLMTPAAWHKLWTDLTELAIFRRTLKLLYTYGYPGSGEPFQKLIGLNRRDAQKYHKRLQGEGFLESRIVEFNQLGFVASSVPAKNAKPGVKKQTKKKNTRQEEIVLVKSPDAKERLERYFQPAGELVREFVMSHRPTNKKAPLPKQNKSTGNVLVPSSSINLPSQDPITPPRSPTPPQQEDTQAQPETSSMEPETPTPRNPPKRRISTRISENRAKKTKMSLAQDRVDMSCYD